MGYSKGEVKHAWFILLLCDVFHEPSDPLVKINPSSLHFEGKSNDIQGNPHLVRALSCQRSMVIHGQISPLKSTLVLTYLKLHYTTKVGISTDRPEDSHDVFRRV